MSGIKIKKTIMEDDVVRYGNLPVKSLANQIINYFQRANPDFPEELAYELNHRGFKPTLVYNNYRGAISVLAEISDDGEIAISEAYLAFLWCLAYASITYYHEGQAKADTFSEAAQLATRLLDYGQSLFNHWSTWDSAFPNPENPNPSDTVIPEANAVMIIASIFVLCHEFAHQYLGHLTETSTYDERKEDEFRADNVATEIILKGINYEVPGYEHTIKLGITIGIGSLLFASPNFSGGPVHPDTDERIRRVLFEITEGPDSEYWVHGIGLLNLWELIYYGKLTEPSNKMDAQAHFDWLVSELKSRINL